MNGKRVVITGATGIEAIRNNFGPDATTDEVLGGIDLTGKLALVTGATSGLGAETARAIASKGAQVLITARNVDKAAKVLHVIELENRLGRHCIHAYAVHSGVIQTELSRHMDQADFDMIISRAGGNLKAKTIPAGAATSVYAATAPELEGRGGLYIYDCQIAEANDDISVLDCVRPYAVDPAAAARLWSVSEEMVGERFDL